jgi:hypothetical protein
LQRCDKLGRCCIAHAWLFGQHELEHIGHAAGDRSVILFRRNGQVVDDGAAEAGRIVCRERQHTRQHEVGERAQPIDVSGRVPHDIALELFRGNECQIRGVDHVLLLSVCGRHGDCGKPEVGDEDVALV